ncbi:MAG: tRNA dihydrouridine synthase DusB, partial [Acetobacteraceae bacterium]
TITGVRLARKHIAWYSKGLPGSAEFRSGINQVDTAVEVAARIEGFYRPLMDLGLEAARARFHALGHAGEKIAA